MMQTKNWALATALLSILTRAFANTEKAIFLGPQPILLPSTHPNVDDLALHRLTPDASSFRTYLNSTFATEGSPKGSDTWVLLDELVSGQRYEVRVCWLATQPTSFNMQTHTLDDVFSSPSLLTSLTAYSYSRIDLLSSDPSNPLNAPSPPLDAVFRDPELHVSLLFLQISAAADYFTMNETLMKTPEAVHVDVILDPFLGNVFPRSLVPTAGYLVLVACVAWYVAGRASRMLEEWGKSQDGKQKDL